MEIMLPYKAAKLSNKDLLKFHEQDSTETSTLPLPLLLKALKRHRQLDRRLPLLPTCPHLSSLSHVRRHAHRHLTHRRRAHRHHTNHCHAHRRPTHRHRAYLLSGHMQVWLLVRHPAPAKTPRHRAYLLSGHMQPQQKHLAATIPLTLIQNIKPKNYAAPPWLATLINSGSRATRTLFKTHTVVTYHKQGPPPPLHSCCTRLQNS
ncbi:uncharacterized protein BDR25DRAFT_396560 [Lindgomyces ingoldianus]|uniref:Uncharacterized protein n=1 Tax=Lindgomyces ingoldianus TaxID=673940 RepID=A0ACB6QDC1_9PLEO|nr:uncharacterized protein BDR25DRAFT_396560 [Lindgomyces ingoldianus]KAF2464968.1 hypothetical protein BDR25DRAFT_396560 [Lindgomyces ingoldianus]